MYGVNKKTISFYPSISAKHLNNPYIQDQDRN